MNNDALLVRQVGKYTVKVIQSKCIAAASCVAISPTFFKLNEQNLAEIIEGGIDEEDNILLSAQSCPTGAIEIYEGESRVWPPM
jgi:ferredoxin